MSDVFSTPQPGRPAGSEQEVVETVRRIMGEDPSDPARPANISGSTSGMAAGTSNGIGIGNGHGIGNGTGSQQTTDVAKEQASDVADSAKQAGAQVTQTVKEQAAEVTNEAGRQAKQLLANAQAELSEQAAQQQQKVAGGLQALADELDGMVRGSEQDGVATDLARQAAERARQIGAWLEDRDPGSLLDEVRNFGRRRPGAYLAIAAGAGILAGRLARGLSASDDGIPTQRSRSAGDARPVRLDPTDSASLTGPYGLADTTAGPSVGLDRGGYPHGSTQNVPTTGSLPGEGDDFTSPPVQVAPGPVPGLGATNVVGGPRGDLSR